MNYFLGYLLIGFVFHWGGVQFFNAPRDEDWRWGLASIVLWPLTVLVAIVSKESQGR